MTKALTFGEALIRYAGSRCHFCNGKLILFNPAEKYLCQIRSCGEKLQYRKPKQDFYCHGHKESWSIHERYCGACGMFWSFNKMFVLAMELPRDDSVPGFLGSSRRIMPYTRWTLGC